MATFLDDWDGSQRCFRTLKLIVEGGGYFTRELIKQKALQPSGAFTTMDAFLVSTKTKIYTLKRKDIVNDFQFDILYPPTKDPTNIEKWDITLASCVLKSCLKLNKRELKAVEEIRELRNALQGHAATMSLTELEFQTHWKSVSFCLTNALSLLNSAQCQKHVSEMIQKIPTEMLSPGETIDTLKQWFKWDNAVEKKLDDIYTFLRELSEDVRSNRDIVCNVDIQLKEHILKKEHIDQPKLYKQIDDARTRIKAHDLENETHTVIETERERTGVEKLKENNIIILTGIPGSGKTFLAFNILKQIMDKDSDLDPLIMNVLKEFKKVLDLSKLLVLFVDDMLGKFSVDNSELDQWNRYVDQFLSFTKTRKLLAIITIRKNIMLKCTDENVGKLFQTDYIYDLDKNQLSIMEKKEMITTYAERNTIKVDREELNIALTQREYGIGFPLLCTLMKGQYNPDLFSRPVECLKDEFLKIRKKDTASFVALLMTLFCDDKLYRSGVDEQSHCFKEIYKHFKSSGIDEAKMFDAAEALVSTYLTFNATHEYFSFVHDTIAESTFSAARECIQDILIRFCPIGTLTKFFVLEQERTENSEQKCTHIPNIPSKKLVDRFKSEICSNKSTNAIQCIGSSSLWQDQAFCENAFGLLDSIDFYREDQKIKSLLCYMSCFREGDLIQRIIETKTSNLPNELIERQTNKSTTEACRFGKVDCFQILINNITKISDEMMFAAVQGGNVTILESLFRKGGGNILSRKLESNECLLHEACARGDYAIVNTILGASSKEEKAQLLTSTTVDEQKTPLLYAATNGNLEIVRLLLDNGSNIDHKDKDGFNILHYAAVYANIDVVKHIFAHHTFLINTKSTKGYTAAHSATAGNITCLSYVLSQGLDAVDVTVDGGTLLHEASINGNVKVVKYLCEKYDDMKRLLDNDSETACHYAARGGHVDCLETLIEQGVDPNGKNRKGYTPIHEAAFCGKIDILKYLCDTCPGMIHMNDDNEASAAHHAAAGGHLESLHYLLRQGIYPFIITNRGFTLLHQAAYCGRLNIVIYLCKTYKEMIKEMNSFGGNAAHSAVSGGHTDCLKYLIGQGTDVIESRYKSDTLLHTACFFGRIDIVRQLCQSYKQLIEMTDDKGKTAAVHATARGHLECLEILIKHGKDPFSVLSGDQTLLHTASRYGHVHIVEYLCELHCIFVNSEDNAGRTAAYLAASHGHLQCLTVLIKFGTNPMFTFKDGKTLLHAAARFGHLNVTKYLCENFKDLTQSTDNDGRTEAYVTASEGHLECSNFPSLISSKDNNERTAADFAALNGHVECLKILIEHGVDPLAKCGDETLLHEAARYGHLNVLKYLCEDQDLLKLVNTQNLLKTVDTYGCNAAHEAALGGHLQCLRYLLQLNADLVTTTYDQRTLLHLAAGKGKTDVVYFLCEEHTSMLHVSDKYGITAAQMSAKEGHLECLEHLLNQGAETMTAAQNEFTLLHFAASKGRVIVVDFLCEKYTGMINRQDTYGQTAAHVSASEGHLDCLKSLLQQEGCDPMITTNIGYTLLHSAAFKGRANVADVLCEKLPCLIDMTDIHDKNAAHLTASKGHLNCLQILLNRGSNPMNAANKWKTILHFAAQNGRVDIVEYLCNSQQQLVQQYKDTAIRLAMQSGHADSVAVLEKWCLHNIVVTVMTKGCPMLPR